MTSLSSKEGGGSGDGPAVELIVKSANQSFDDLIVQCENDGWSVKQLKSIITEQYPCKLVSLCFVSYLISLFQFLVPRGIGRTTQKKF